MSDCTLVSNTAAELVVRHEHTGREFAFRLEGDNLMLGLVREGH